MSRIITTLKADRQLTKRFNADGSSEAYPHVTNFTSSVVGYQSIEDLCEIITVVGGVGGCLLKGHLTKQINNESRRSLHQTTAATDLLVVDYDSDGGFETFDELLYSIDPLLAATDYVFQHSASAGIKGPAGLRGHAFFLLENFVSPNLIKQWFKKINLSENAPFRRRVRLSRNAMALCYPLDITVNQNDKLIFVAPPILSGIEDPLKERIELRVREHRTYAFDTSISAAGNRDAEDALIAELQDRAGLTKRKPKYKSIGDDEILINPAPCEVTDSKITGAYVRINLNGGDSFAYWYFRENPEILYNFKGEPPVYLRDVAPQYYEQIQQLEHTRTIRPFVFRDMQSDTYFAAEYNEEVGKVTAMNRVRQRGVLLEFMTQRGRPAPRVIPDWTVYFDPTNTNSVDFTNHTINLFKSTPYLERKITEVDKVATEADFPVIAKTIRHICVDEETYQHFITWLAYIVQTRQKTQTAWIFSGCEGTGKGTLFHKILTPILGREQCYLLGQGQVGDNFNGYLQHNMLLFLDEGDIANNREADKLLATLRTIITEPVVGIRMMRTNPFNAPNFTNIIVATNKSMPIRLVSHDRRYNVAPRQNRKIAYEEGEYETIEYELQDFTLFLKQRSFEESDVRTVLQNAARAEMLELSRTVADEFFESIQAGDLDVFTERLQESAPFPDNGYTAYARVVQNWMAATTKGETIVCPIDELCAVYRYFCTNDTIDPKRFAHAAGRHDMRSRRMRISGIQKSVYELKFEDRSYTEWLSRGQKANVVSLKSK